MYSNCTPNVLQVSTSNGNKCKYCDKSYSSRQNKWKHEQKCKEEYDIKQNALKEIKIKELDLECIKEKNKSLKTENKNLELQIKLAKLNGNTTNNGTMAETVNNNTTNNTNSNNTNNGTIAETVNNTNSNNTTNNVFVKYNNVYYDKMFIKKEMKEIMKDPENLLENAISKFHFSSEYPENNNIFITNLKDKIIHVFDGEKFVDMDKKEVINELMDEHTCQFVIYVAKNKKYNEMLENFRRNVFKSEKKYVDDNNNVYKNYKEYKFDKIKKLIYNKCDKEKYKEIKKLKEFVLQSPPEDSDDE